MSRFCASLPSGPYWRAEADRRGGLLGRLTKMIVEGALEGELDDHLGYASTTRKAATR